MGEIPLKNDKKVSEIPLKNYKNMSKIHLKNDKNMSKIPLKNDKPPKTCIWDMNILTVPHYAVFLLAEDLKNGNLVLQ